MNIPRGIWVYICEGFERVVRQKIKMQGVRGKIIGHRGWARAQLPFSGGGGAWLGMLVYKVHLTLLYLCCIIVEFLFPVDLAIRAEPCKLDDSLSCMCMFIFVGPSAGLMRLLPQCHQQVPVWLLAFCKWLGKTSIEGVLHIGCLKLLLVANTSMAIVAIDVFLPISPS